MLTQFETYITTGMEEAFQKFKMNLNPVNSPEHFHFWKCFGPQAKTNNYPIRARILHLVMRGLC